MRITAALVGVVVLLSACGGREPPPGDAAALARLRSIVSDACTRYSSAKLELLAGHRNDAYESFIDAGNTIAPAWDLMFDIRSARVDAGYTGSEALLHAFPAIEGDLYTIADVVRYGASEFTFPEELLISSMEQVERECPIALDTITKAMDKS